MEVELEVESTFEVKCAACGHSLDAEFGKDYKNSPVLSVSPCEVCLEVAEEEGKAQAEEA